MKEARERRGAWRGGGSVGMDSVGTQRKREGHSGEGRRESRTEIHPSVWVPRIVQLSLQPTPPSGAFCKHTLQLPRLAPALGHPFRPGPPGRAEGEGKELGSHTRLPRTPLPLLGIARGPAGGPARSLQQIPASWPPRSVLISVGKQYSGGRQSVSVTFSREMVLRVIARERTQIYDLCGTEA